MNDESITVKYGMFNERLSNMSLRDWFAGMAMQGDISASGDMALDVEALVGWSYEVANAMMEARDGDES